MSYKLCFKGQGSKLTRQLVSYSVIIIAKDGKGE